MALKAGRKERNPADRREIRASQSRIHRRAGKKNKIRNQHKYGQGSSKR